jgi:predicted RNA-binding protein with TRAM domain
MIDGALNVIVRQAIVRIIMIRFGIRFPRLINNTKFGPISPVVTFQRLHSARSFIMPRHSKRFRPKKRKTQDPLDLDIQRLTNDTIPDCDPPFSYLQEVIVDITSLSFTGEGIGTAENGWFVVVPFTLPGEKVKAKIYQNHR